MEQYPIVSPGTTILYYFMQPVSMDVHLAIVEVKVLDLVNHKASMSGLITIISLSFSISRSTFPNFSCP